MAPTPVAAMLAEVAVDVDDAVAGVA